MMARRRDRGGLALLIVLSIVILLSIMSISFHDMVSSQLRIARKDVDRFRALQLARAGLNLAIMLVKLDPQFNDPNAMFLPDPTYQTKQSEAGASLTKIEEAYLLLRASEETGMPLEGGSVKVIIRDEAARVNLNALVTHRPPEFLLNLFHVANVRKRKKLKFSDTVAADDVSMPLANTILDWIDQDNTALPEGAESSHYQRKEPRYKARNGYMESLDELMLLRHMDRSMMEGVKDTDRMPGSIGLRDLLTLYGNSPAVNANTAPPALLSSVPGIFESANREQLVSEIIRNRPMRSPGALTAVINAYDSNALTKAGNYLTTNSTMLRITVRAELGSFEGSIETVIWRDPQGFIRTLYWSET